MDNTRRKAKRKPGLNSPDPLQNAKRFLQMAIDELHETGRTDSDTLDWAMNDAKEAHRRVNRVLEWERVKAHFGESWGR
jgi:hypothetical protein